MLAAQVVVTETQVFRTYIFSTPFAVLRLRLEANEAKATIGAVLVPFSPALFMLGCSLIAFAGVVPSDVETRTVVAVQVVVMPAQVS